jgi:glycosyltransferase involved in cell wall biosynthesis
MRILHVAGGNLFGGIETFLVTLARQRDVCPTMKSSFALCFEGRLADELRSVGASVYNLGPARVSRPWTVWRLRRRLTALLRAEHFDAVATHGCWPHALVAPVVQRAGSSLVFWAHAIQAGQHWLERWARRYPPILVIANSRVTQQSVTANLFSDAACVVVHVPVASSIALDKTRRQQIRESLGTEEDTVVIIIVSRIEQGKGHAVLLDALSQLPSGLPWNCWIVGGAQRAVETAYLARLHARTQKLGLVDRVHFIGARSDARDLLASADIHCQPNTAPDSFGIAFVEALYAGVPVVTTAMGGALEIIDQNCGVLLDRAEPAALATELARLIGDREGRRRIGVAGPAQAARLCDPSNQMRRIGQVLQEVARA